MRRLTIIPILTIFNLDWEAILKTNILDYIIDIYLTQKRNNDKIRIVVFYSCKIIESKLNYDIYDKELLIVVEALWEWRVYLEGTKYSI